MPKLHLRNIGAFPGYQVSKSGYVYSSKRGKLHRLVGRVNSSGYAQVNLQRPHGQGEQTCIVHRLVATAFVPGWRPNYQVNHKDGNKRHNSDNNLEWVSASANMQHALQAGHQLCKLTADDVRNIRHLIAVEKLATNAIAKQYKVAKGTIRKIRTGKSYQWVV
jgi:hypothetical protein